MGTPINIADVLFSKTQQRVLALLFGHSDRSFYLKEIIDWVNAGRGAVQRELEKMTAAGLVTKHTVGNRHHYQANKKCPVYKELRGVVNKTFGDQYVLQPVVEIDDRKRLMIGGQIKISRTALKKLAKRFHIRRLSLFGSAARGELTPDSDIDLLVEFENDRVPSLGGMVEIQDAFVNLFGGRKVDVATPSILNNPYRKRAIEKDRKELYAA